MSTVKLPMTRASTRRLHRRLDVDACLLAAMFATLAAYVVGLAAHDGGFELLVDGVLGVLTQALPALVCWAAVRRAGTRRPEVVCVATGLTAFTIGNTVYVTAASSGAELPFPSLADAGFLLFYPFALAAITLAVRRELRGVIATVWLDSLLGALGAAAVLAAVLTPSFTADSNGTLGGAVAMAYPFFDLLMVATVVGVCALQGLRVRRHWVPLIVGLAVFTAADVQFALRIGAGTYVVGTLLDALWPIAMASVALWVRSGPPPSPPRAAGTAALTVPALTTTAAVIVLVWATRSAVSPIAVALATGTLIAIAGRTQFAFSQLRRLGDLRRQATTDDLTGLPNRRAFSASVGATLAAASSPGALLLLDLDRFKEVNDSLGHHVGDELIVEIGARLRKHLRGEDIMARLGGDEFAVLLEGVDREMSLRAAEKLRGALVEPFTLQGVAVRMDASVGIALFPEHGTDMSQLLRRADIAMYQAKASHEGQRVHDCAEEPTGEGRLRTVAALRTALAEGQLTLHYQPKVALQSGRVHGVEALVRWDHPERGLLYPDSFLDVVQESGLMGAMTTLVLEQALDQAAVWRSLGRPLTVAVNLSPSSLVDAHLPATVAAMLALRDLPASSLMLEITEEFLMADRNRGRDILTRLRDQGIRIAVDDFGTGYSSLAYLRDLPIDELKLDRSFVFPMADDARAAALVQSVIGLAHSLGLRIVAEGVENVVAYTELTRLGCDEAQGYFLSRPVPAAELDHWLAGREVAAAAVGG